MNRQSRFAFQLLFMMGLVIATSSCTKQELASTGIDVTGEYTLVSVDGGRVPTTIDHGGVSLQVLSGTFTIKADGTCSTSTVFVPPTGVEVVREVSATYTRNGSRLTMQWQGAGMTEGAVEGNTFRMDNEGMIFVYHK